MSEHVRREFDSVGPSVLRSIKQRDFLNAWLRARRDAGGFPPMSAYFPARLEEERKELVYYVVQHRHDGCRILINSKGSDAAAAYGTSGKNNIGTDLNEYLPPDMRPLVMPLYLACVARKLPVYSMSRLEDIEGRAVIHERLLLPFFENGIVSDILASLKAISEDGKFEISNLLRNKDKLPEYCLRAVIDQDLSANRALRETAERKLASSLNSDSDIVEI